MLDDGAELLNIFYNEFNKIMSDVSIVGVEQTSSGFRKLENIKLNYPVLNVARSAVKLNKESPLIARLGCNRIEDVIRKYKIEDPRIMVVGLGPIGSNVSKILKDDGYYVLGHDTVFDSESEISAIVMKNNINMLIGATGTSILTEKQITQLEQTLVGHLYLISMSSSDREFPAAFIRMNGKMDEAIHGDSFWKKLILINNGFPITFKGKRYESTPKEIEKTISLLYGSVISAATSKFDLSSFVELPKPITDIIENDEFRS